MEKVRHWCGQPSDRGRLKNRTEQNRLITSVMPVSVGALLAGRCHVPLVRHRFIYAYSYSSSHVWMACE